MKKIITIMLIATLSLTALTGCKIERPEIMWAKTVKIVRHWAN